MTAGETLLKITDYPFAYTFVILLGGMFGFTLTENKLLLLGIAGAFGTFLTIVDPWGLFVKWQIKRRLKETSEQSSHIYPKIEFHYKAINSRSIGIEIDRIVGMIYFAIGLFLFIIAMWSPYSFVDNFIIRDTNQNAVCDSLCVQISSTVVASIVIWILNLAGSKKWNELDKKLKIAAAHQFAIGNEYAVKNSVENMARAIDLGDWTSAEEWSEEIKEEIENKKGKREIVLKSAEYVFRPLHEDGVAIASSCRGILNAKQYYGITPNTWEQLRRSGTHLMIDENTLRHRIDNFYTLIADYNNLVSKVNRMVDKLIRDHMTNTFQKQVRFIRYFVKYLDTHSDPNLAGCALFKIHPLEHIKNEKMSPLQIDIEFQNEPTITTKSVEDFAKFDSAWKAILSDVEKNEDITKLKNMLDNITIENEKLLVIYEKRIEMQWKV